MPDRPERDLPRESGLQPYDIIAVAAWTVFVGCLIGIFMEILG